MVEFIEEWFIEQTLGEGAFGEVKLLVNRRTKAEVALKVIDAKEHPDALEVVRKEVQIHKMLNHDNIIRFYGSRKDGLTEYLFLEYASGGELFDRIEPDVGMDPTVAQSHFQQLICGVEYLHSLGIAHRDLKPENILLDGKGQLKISDFGFATIFRIRGVERLLEKRCGTLPYVAPEVLQKQYKAVPADIWSCGVILVALLAGELPWDRPCLECPEYKNWKDDQKVTQHQLPWKKLELTSLNFVKRILCSQPSKRLTVEQMLVHPWMTKRPSHGNAGRMSGGSPLNKKIASGMSLPRSSVDDSLTRLFSYSQPEPSLFGEGQEFDEADSDEVREPEPQINDNNKRARPPLLFSFSQPATPADDFFIGSQMATSPSKRSGQGAKPSCLPIHRLVKRMTRLCVSTSVDKTVKELCEVLDGMGCTFKVHRKPFPMVTITMMDRRKTQLVFKANIVEMGPNNLVLLDFRLSRGDGLEFKRQFVRLREQLKSIEMTGPVSWPLAVATNCIP